MTNLIIISVHLTTNWAGIYDVATPPFEQGYVTRHAAVGYWSGTNAVWCGNTIPAVIGQITKTNGVAGQIKWTTKQLEQTKP